MPTCSLALCLLVMPLLPLDLAAQQVSHLPERPRLMHSLAELPLGFEENRGQAEADVRFLAYASGYAVYLSRGSLLVRFDVKPHDQGHGEEIRIGITGADRSVEPQGIEVLPGTINYYIGKDPAQWKTGLRQFGRVRYGNVYPGVDLVFYGNRQHLEFDFDLAPEVDISTIILNIEGAVIKPSQGNLELTTPSGKTLILKRPAFFQGAGSARRRVSGGYVMRRHKEVAFSVGGYNRRQALVIDPALVYSTLVGSSVNDHTPFAIAVDGGGAAYVTGESVSPGPVPSVFVLKFDPSGSTLLYQTHLGGTNRLNSSNPDTPAAGFGIGADANGNAYIAGLTDESDFPTTAGAFSAAAFCASTSGNVGCMEPFAAKLDANGKLVYSTFLAESSSDSAGPVPSSLAVDSAGATYVTGTTLQQTGMGGTLSVAGLPTTAGAFQTKRKDSSSAFVLKLHPDGSKLDYSTYLGGTTGETPGGIAVDSNGIAYVDGGTSSSDFPVTPGASLTTNPGTAGFFTKLKADGSGLLYSTFVAGPKGQAEGTSIAIDSNLAAYLTGLTNSSFPTPGLGNFSLPTFAAKFDASGNLIYSSLLATQTYGLDLFFGTPPQSSIAVDNTGAVHVASASGGFFESSIVESKLDSSGSVVYTVPVGPINPTNSRFGGAALDGQLNFYVTGVAGSLEDPVAPFVIPDIGTTAGAFQTLPIVADPEEIMFVQKWRQTLGAAVPVPNPRQISFSPILQKGVTSAARTIQLFNYGDSTLAFSGASLGGANAADFAISANNNSCGTTVAVGASCSFLVTFTPTVSVGTRNGTVTLSFGGGLVSQTVALIGQAGTPAFSASPSPVDFGNVGVGATSDMTNLTITNTGTGPMNIQSLPVFQGTNASDFSICVLIVGHCGGAFSPPTPLAPGRSFTVPLVFTPDGNGARSAQIVFNTDVPGGQQSVLLQGNGVPTGSGGFSLNGGGSSTASVNAGQTATYNLSVIASQGVSISVTCSGAPPAASCAANPSSFSLSPGPTGTGSQSVTVSVTTTARTSGSLRRMFPGLGWPVVAIVGILGSPRKRRSARMTLMLSVLAVLGLAASCGGGSSGSGGGGRITGTPAGTYTLTVTATGNGASHSMPLTLTVQ
jgi:hypothetical protein